MIEFSIDVFAYDVSAGIGWGYVVEYENTTYDVATAAVYTAVTPSGFGHDIALIGTGPAWGAISNTLSGYAVEQHLGSGGLGDIVAYDDADYSYISVPFITSGTSVTTTWSATAVTPSGFGHDIGLGGPTWGAFQEIEFIVIKTAVFTYTVAVLGDIDVVFTVEPPLVCNVVGTIDVSFGNLVGAVTIEGACDVEGEINVTFVTTVVRTCAIIGEITVVFGVSSGQTTDCISPDDTVPDEEATGGEENYVF